MLTLYDFPRAPSPRRARIFLGEKGLEFDTVHVDLTRNEQLSDAYRAINPHCTVPALRLDDGRVLTDNASIAAYLEARFPEPPLMGRSPEEKAEIAHWHWRAEFEGLMAVAEAMRNSAPAMQGRALPGPVDYAQIPALTERGLARVSRFFDTLNTRLQDRDTLATEDLSVADITALVAVDFARVVRLRPGEQHGHLLRWQARLNARPAFR